MWETERLVLARLEQRDLDPLFAIHADPRTWEHRPDLVMTDRAEAERDLAAWRAHWQAHGFGYAAVRRRDGARPEGEVIGFCGLRWTHLGQRLVLNLYYRFSPEAQGAGCATEAARAVVDWARATHPDTPVVAVASVNNPASRQVAEKAGLHLVRELPPTDAELARTVLATSDPWELPIVVTGLVVRDDTGRVLTVRKRGTERFMLPGGKPEPGEDAAAAGARELAEEVGLTVDPAAMELLGRYSGRAANEPDTALESTVFLAPLTGDPVPAAEIAEMCWIAPAEGIGGAETPVAAAGGRLLAPLLAEHVLPVLRAHG
ncbi:GNAT family N-acetyltransferase [Kytococcus sp. Marseille-QA3725]